MNLYEKILKMQQEIDSIVKDSTVGEGKQSYKAVTGEQVLNRIRPMMNEMGLLLLPSVTGARVMEGKTSSGTSRYFTEVFYNLTWHDVASGEELTVPWYGQGVDLAGEKGVGKAATYSEKYYFMKALHIPTPADDPDADNRTQSGEKSQRGTQAEKENRAMMRKAIPQIMAALYGDDEEKIKAAYVWATKSDARGYAGVDNLAAVKDAALAPVYGKLKTQYQKRTGKEFEYTEED